MPVQNEDLIINSFRGGMNDTDDPLELQTHEVVLAQNVEFLDRKSVV